MTLFISIKSKPIWWTFALAAALAADSARAADLPSRKPIMVYAPPAAFSWTGVYAGFSAGGGLAGARDLGSYTGGANAGRIGGVVAGGQAGYNYQVSPYFVVGIENDLSFTSLKIDDVGGARVHVPVFGTGRARAGLAVLDSKLLLYGTAGLAGAQVNDTGVDKLRMGWTAGGGIEWAFRPNWSIKAEYLYTDLYKDLKDQRLPERHEKFHTVRVGLNYHFDLFRPSDLGSGY